MPDRAWTEVAEMRRGRSFLRRLPLAVVALGISASLTIACGGGAPAAPSGPPAHPGQSTAASPAKPAAQSVTFRFDWLVSGYDGAVVIARDKGFYKDAGVDVKLEEGKNSTATAEGVASGNDTFGFADATVVARLVGQGAPIKCLAGLVQNGPQTFIHGPAVSIKSPADLKGRSIIALAGGSPTQLLPAVLKKAGLTVNDVHLVSVDPSAEASTLKTHPDWILIGFVNDTYPAVLKIYPEALSTPYSDFGVSPLSLCLITSNSEISAHPDTVKGFVAASLKGWQYSVAHPDEAVAATHKAFPNADEFELKKGLELSAPLTHTPATEGKPLGWMAQSDWEATLQLLQQYGGMKTVKPTGDYFTNQFIPAS